MRAWAEKDTTPPPTFEPFPGTAWFKTSPRSPIVTAMGRRLVEVGCGAYTSGPGPQWTPVDRESVRRWQHKLGDNGGLADGWFGPLQWAALQVPKV
ncbi:peptidoglycan-binding protein [Streptomyces sp. AcH 505]|uniref:peptidoglycan-binding protein n=1 Tax=Streptomyces sp. AcH 505 TaxID=352211 RepID=UPI00240FE46D